MLPIAGQTALPIGLTFFMDSYGLLGGVFQHLKKQKNVRHFFKILFSTGNATGFYSIQ